ncbi:hypothetical protein ig2599ANME_1259 [groundwater metagenome]
MSLPIPNLDDRSFDDLMKEARSLIPVYDREWTNYNPSDPGITLLELFSWLSEMSIYRINKVPEENYRNFLKLIGVRSKTAGTGTILSESNIATGDGTVFTEELEVGDSITAAGQTRIIEAINSDTSLTVDSAFDPALPAGTNFSYSYESIESGIRKGLKSLSPGYRAITQKDYESLAKDCMKTLQKDLAGRAVCLNNRNLEYGDSHEEKPGHVTVIIIPRCNRSTVYCKDDLPTDELKIKVKDYLDARRLITTRVHVVAPEFQKVRLEVSVALEENKIENKVKDDARERINKYFDPLEGGKDGKGWPLGRSIYRSEIYQLIEGISGVDHVVKVKINGSDADVVEIGKYQLISLDFKDENLVFI